MSNGSRQNPHFHVRYSVNRDLQALARPPWVYHAETAVLFARGSGARRRLGPPLPVRLDTESFVSALPQQWLPALLPFLRLHPTSL